ncbi:MAG TPA: DUF72 domain-containing protein [Thermoanaerobaculia bacterium]
MDDPNQLPLFGGPLEGSKPARRGLFAERLEKEIAECAAIAARLPENVRFGTSSWSFPGWAGIVYSRRASASELAKTGLIEYARHPLLGTVGIDRGFYAPIPAEDLRRYAEQLPPGFPCCTKAPEAVTGAANPEYLSARRFEEDMLAPFWESFAGHAGPFLLQFPPAPPAARSSPREFAETLDRFLGQLPRRFRYAVELRDPTLLTEEYGRVLASRGAAHVYNCASAMPMPEDQALRIPAVAAPFVVVRLLLRPGTRYDDRREEFLPFDRIVDPNPEMRRQTVELARAAAGRDVFVLVNNKAEGCAPATIRALAEELARKTEFRPVST